jgi:hypothetical protein
VAQALLLKVRALFWIDPIMSIDALSTANDAASRPPIAAFNSGAGPSFSDLLDILNPLQHIPIINTIYQHLTGDSEGAVADVAGGTLWTGPIGLVGSLLDLQVRSDTGKSIGDTVLGWLGLESDDSDSAVARQDPEPVAPAQQQAALAAVPAAQSLALAAAPLPSTSPPRGRPQSSKAGSDANATSSGDDPQKIGNFLVFGAAGSGTPTALLPTATSPVTTTASATAGPITRQGSFVVFGANQPAAAGNTPIMAASLPPPPAASATASAMTRQGSFAVFGADQPAAAGTAPIVAAAGAAVVATPQRSLAAPARRAQQTPLAPPPPTTGPAALPGHGPSQAIPAPNPDDDWFTQAVAAGLNKYQAAQKLGAGAPAAATLGTE